MADRWFFHHPNGHDTYIVDGDPSSHPDFKGWLRCRGSKYAMRTRLADGEWVYREPSILFDGRLLMGKRMRATQDDAVKCTTGCRRATEPWCICSCGGKNHGVENNKLEKADVVYVGDH